MLDMHSHVIYGVDDGSTDRDMSLAMLRAARSIGIDTIIATPHMRGRYQAEDLIRRRYEELAPEAVALGIRLKLGFEFHYSLCLELKDRLREFCLDGTETLLLEFDFNGSAGVCERVIDMVQRAGCDIIVAHPERYQCVEENPIVAERWRDRGCQLQLDGLSLSGGIFDKTARTARTLLNKGLIDLIATDAHRPEHYARYAAAVRKLDLSRFDQEI